MIGRLSIHGVAALSFKVLSDWRDGEPARISSKNHTLDAGVVHQVKAYNDADREISGSVLITSTNEESLLNIFRSSTVESLLEIPSGRYTGYLKECSLSSRDSIGKCRYRLVFFVTSSVLYR